MICGETIQQSCDIYIGNRNDFFVNPVIRNEPTKHKALETWTTIFDNPTKLFCYSHCIDTFAQKLDLLQNNFILYSHNSDKNIVDSIFTRRILNHPKCIEWHAQNKCMDHAKLRFLPIGLANSMWPHGIHMFKEVILRPKSKGIYFNFNIKTNALKRNPCYLNLKDKLEWLSVVPPLEHFQRLSAYNYCVCPEGNGVDTHRVWECVYLKVIPIVIDSEFTRQLSQHIHVIILQKWNYTELVDKLAHYGSH
jgi:hypothetical protein